MGILQLSICSIQFLLLCNYYESVIAIRGPVGTAVNLIDQSNKDYNFVAAIERKKGGTLLCTGSLITNKHVLSAEHCMKDEKKENLQVSVGSYNRQKGVKYSIADVKSFRQWVADTKYPGTFFGDQDIAVFTLSTAITIKNINFMPITKKPKSNFYGKTATILGWGTTYGPAETASLQIAQINILSPEQCRDNIKAYFGNEFTLAQEEFCSNTTLGTQLGTGDSGGPLIYANEIIGTAESTYPHDDDKEYRKNAQNIHVVLEKHHRHFIKSFKNGK